MLPKNWRDSFAACKGSDLESELSKAPTCCRQQYCEHMKDDLWCRPAMIAQELRCREVAWKIALEGCRPKPAKGGT